MTGRLLGLETEYAIRLDQTDARSHRLVYDEVCRIIGKSLPTAAATLSASAKTGIFLGTGGAVWFETLFPLRDTGLIEGATPECRSARAAVACQRAQDRILQRAAAKAGVSLLKNSHDGKGNIYGSQENFEVEFADRKRLIRWKPLCRILLIVCLAWFVLAVIVGVLLLTATVPVGWVFYLIATFRETDEGKRIEWFDIFVGRFFRPTPGMATDLPCGSWMSRMILVLSQVAIIPYTLLIMVLLRFTNVPRIHNNLTAFVASRMLICGAGSVTRNGKFRIADKAEGINAVTGLAEFFRPMFSLGQFIKPGITFDRLNELFEPRQRIQVSAGDSNMCEQAEFLRVGTTLLVIDMITACPDLRLPRVCRPVRSMRRISRDLELRGTYRMKDGSQKTAIQIQREYLDACRRFVDETRPDDEEAADILARWQATLDQLEKDPETLVGLVDWVTKRFLIRQTCEDEKSLSPDGIATRRKIDLKYHELGPDGYFHRFEQTGFHEKILRDEQIDSATRLPPADSPAMKRARLIREFAGTGVTVGWKKLSNGIRIE